MLFSVPPDYQTKTNRKENWPKFNASSVYFGPFSVNWRHCPFECMQTNIPSSHTSINSQEFAWHRSGCCFEKGCCMKSVKPRLQDRMVVWVFIGILHIGVTYLYSCTRSICDIYIHEIFH